MPRRSVTALLLVLAALLAASAPAATTSASKRSVTIAGSGGSYAFSPKKLTIKHGKKVTWSWTSDAEHNVTFSKLGGKHSKTASSVSGFSVKFKNKGTYKYMCTVHGFTGKIVVN
jgi:plastocyanin